MATRADSIAVSGTAEYSIWRVILASAVGTMIEWYDFYIFGSLTAILAPNFYPPGNDTFAYIAYLATFAVGFLVRPFGALFFGRIGDLVGRKYAFMMTLLIMGISTAAIGLLPGYGTLCIGAPILLVTLRLLQGLALGGEYGGAAIYVAEHAPDNRRGFYTSWIQTTATIGFFLALAVILIVRTSMTPADFASTGWRYPFLISAILLAIAIYTRMRLQETPLFARLKARGDTTKNTASWAKESFSGRKVGTIALVLLGLTAGQGVVWYQGQFQANFFMTTYLKLTFTQSYAIMLWAVGLGTPFFLFFGWLSDKIGRKVIILSGCLIAAVTYIPIYHWMYDFANVTKDATGLITKADPNVPVL